MRTHTGERPYKCTWKGCDYAATGWTPLQRHIRTHTGEKPYKCTWKGCDYEAAGKGNLTIHMRIHTGDNPYKCMWEGCDYSCKGKSTLNGHMRIHTGETPYKCTFCNYECKAAGALTVHTRIHTGEKPYKCTWKDCDFATTNASSLKKHFQSQHTKEGQARKVRREQRFVKFLEKNNIRGDRQVHVPFSCFETDGQCAYLDYVVYKPTHVLLIEFDENQHEDYDITCEMRRMMDVTTSLKTKNPNLKIAWVRFNPDSFKLNQKKQTVKQDDRRKAFINFITTYVPEKDVEINYFYYDCFKNAKGNLVPECTGNPNFNRNLLPLIGSVVGQ
jgi:hypothetical protein